MNDETEKKDELSEPQKTGYLILGLIAASVIIIIVIFVVAYII